MKKRDVGLDIVRIFAYLFVVNVHAYLYDGFGDAAIKGIAMYVLVFFVCFSGRMFPCFCFLLDIYSAKNRLILQKRGACGHICSDAATFF